MGKWREVVIFPHSDWGACIQSFQDVNKLLEYILLQPTIPEHNSVQWIEDSSDIKEAVQLLACNKYDGILTVDGRQRYAQCI